MDCNFCFNKVKKMIKKPQYGKNIKLNTVFVMTKTDMKKEEKKKKKVRG